MTGPRRELWRFVEKFLCIAGVPTGGGRAFLGATLAPRLMMECPDCVAAILPQCCRLAGPRWYNWLTEFSPVSWVVALSGTGLKQSNDEMMGVRAGLEEVQDTWTLIRHPLTLIQGEDDWLVDPDLVDFIEAKLAHIPARIIRVEKEGASDCPP